jgi:hypothetical protein
MSFDAETADVARGFGTSEALDKGINVALQCLATAYFEADVVKY